MCNPLKKTLFCQPHIGFCMPTYFFNVVRKHNCTKSGRKCVYFWLALHPHAFFFFFLRLQTNWLFHKFFTNMGPVQAKYLNRLLFWLQLVSQGRNMCALTAFLFFFFPTNFSIDKTKYSSEFAQTTK